MPRLGSGLAGTNHIHSLCEDLLTRPDPWSALQDRVPRCRSGPCWLRGAVLPGIPKDSGPQRSESGFCREQLQRESIAATSAWSTKLANASESIHTLRAETAWPTENKSPVVICRVLLASWAHVGVICRC